MTHNLPSAAKAILRNDFVSFISKAFRYLNPGTKYEPPWYIEYLAYELLECQRGNRPRMTISIPPRYGKSTIASVIFPAWCLAHNPARRILCASYSKELSFKLSNQFKQLIESEWYRDLFPDFKINPDKCSEREIQTLANGFRYATYVDGPMTGIGGDMLILDDVIKASDVFSEVERQNAINWMETTAFTRIDNKKTGSIILVGQRLHLQDPIGHLVEKGGWYAVTLPAIAEETKTYELARLKGQDEYTRVFGEVLDPLREPLDVLERTRKEMGTTNFNAQYQQRPEYQEDAYIQWEWFKKYDKPPEFDYLFLSVDPAIATKSTSDWSVCMVIGVLGDENYILNVERKRIDFDVLAMRLDQIATSYLADSIVIEKTGIGGSLAVHLQKQARHCIETLTPIGSKQDRLIAVLPTIETGHMWVPAVAPWLDTLRNELIAFPNGVHDDQVDSLSQFLRYRGKLIQRAGVKLRHRKGRPLKAHYNAGTVKVYTFGGPSYSDAQLMAAVWGK